MKLSKDDVLNFLPHRYPFLFVDSVESTTLADPSQKIVVNPKDLIGGKVHAKYWTDPNHTIFSGHFPGRPILPGVVQVEMMAQASSFIVACWEEGFNTFQLPIGQRQFNLEVALLSISNAKFRKPILPDMHLDIHTECVRYRSNMMSCECKIFHNDELMSESSVMAFISLEKDKK